MTPAAAIISPNEAKSARLSRFSLEMMTIATRTFAMSNLTGAPKGERFTARLEAFSDLVFGFSLSLLATRLDVPARPEDIFNSTRWIAIIGTFALVCRFWLEHYRIFRHDFVAENFDAVLNFVFLFGIAILPYALLTFLRFQLFLSAFTLYAGDFSLILSSLSILRVRSLRQRRGDPDLGGRVGEWRRSVAQFGVAILLALFLLALHSHGGTFMEAMRAYDVYLVMAFILILLGARRGLRSLPAFLSAKGGAGELPA